MFKEMRRNDRQLSEAETIKLLETGEYGILSTSGENGYPYGIPLSYAYSDGNIYFHGAQKGNKLDNIRYNNKVSFCVVGKTEVLPSDFSTNYESAVVFGKAYELDGEEKEKVLVALLKKYSNEFMESGMEYIKRAAKGTMAVKIEIEHITGKSRK